MHSGRGHKRKVDLRFEFPKSFVFQQSFVLCFLFFDKFCVACFAFFVSKKVDVSKELLHNFT